MTAKTRNVQCVVEMRAQILQNMQGPEQQVTGMSPRSLQGRSSLSAAGGETSRAEPSWGAQLGGFGTPHEGWEDRTKGTAE